jgi:hypothetical protein
MLELTDALRTRFDSQIGTNIVGGYWAGLVGEGKAFPFVVMDEISAPIDWRYGNASLYDAQIQFAVYGAGKAATAAKMALVTACYDNVILTLASGKMVSATRLTEPISTFQGKNDDGEDIWQYVTTYRFSVRK